MNETMASSSSSSSSSSSNSVILKKIIKISKVTQKEAMNIVAKREYMRSYMRERNKTLLEEKTQLLTALKELGKREVPWVSKCRATVRGGFTISHLTDWEMLDLVNVYLGLPRRKTAAMSSKPSPYHQ
jgi:hypothetical protein